MAPTGGLLRCAGQSPCRELEPQVASTVPHGAAVQDLHPPAQEYRSRVAKAEGSQVREGGQERALQGREGDLGINGQLGAYVQALQCPLRFFPQPLAKKGQVLRRYAEARGHGVSPEAKQQLGILLEGSYQVKAWNTTATAPAGLPADAPH